MNQVTMEHGAEPRKILETAVKEKIPAVMSYLSKGKWHAKRVIVTGLGADRFDVEVSPRKKPHPLNVRINQQAGISVKYGYGKYIFETTVVGFKPSKDNRSGGTIVLAVPTQIQIIQRRNYFRVEVPRSLKVNVTMWHRCHTKGNRRVSPERYWQGKLLDISAGGAQVAINVEQKPDFRNRQFVEMRFTPLPYETPLMFNAQIRSILPTADGKSVCLGLQLVGLEASAEGRDILKQLCGVVERYYQLRQSDARGLDMQTVGSCAATAG